MMSCQNMRTRSNGAGVRALWGVHGRTCLADGSTMSVRPSVAVTIDCLLVAVHTQDTLGLPQSHRFLYCGTHVHLRIATGHHSRINTARGSLLMLSILTPRHRREQLLITIGSLTERYGSSLFNTFIRFSLGGWSLKKPPMSLSVLHRPRRWRGPWDTAAVAPI